MTALSLALLLTASAALSAGCGNGVGTDLVRVSGGEPQHPLLPTSTVETYGARVVDRLFAGLMSYDANGMAQPEVAEAIESTDNTHFRIRLKRNWQFTDGSPVTAHSFVDAWNFGALSTNGQPTQPFFAPIEGYEDVSAQPPTAQTMSGLQVVDDYEFTVRLRTPNIDFEQRLGFAAFYPLPEAAFADIEAFGDRPIGNGPYQLASGSAWQHNVGIDLVTNPDYRGNRTPQNNGLRFVFFDSPESAYTDLRSGALDVLDTIPTAMLPNFRQDLGERALTAPVAQNQTLDTPLRLDHFGGEEGRLRRLALSAAIDRKRICEQIFHGTRSPARDFTARSLPGFDPKLPGADALEFNPQRAKQLWARADAISRWSGRYTITYNADGDHQKWVDAVAGSIRDTLGIEVVGEARPSFEELRQSVTDRSIDTAFRAGWQGQYPSMLEFLGPLFVTGAPANDVGYSNRDFDGALTVAQAAPTVADSYPLTGTAQRLLLADLPVIPLWDYLAAGGRSSEVNNVELAWNGLPDYERITKSGR